MFVLPWGFSRGDGLTNLPSFPFGSVGSGPFGTPTPAAAEIVNASSQFLAGGDEAADSPTIERSVQATAMHRCRMPWANALAYISVLPRGTVVQDAFGNIWRVLSASIQHEKGDVAILTTTAESVSFDSPPDEFQVNTVDMGIDIIKHPRYFPNIYPTSAELGTEVGFIKESIIRAIQTYRDSPFFPTSSNLNGLLNGMIQENVVALTKNGTFAYPVPNPAFNAGAPVTADFDSNGNPQSGNTVHLIHTYPGTVSNSPSVNLALAAAMEIITKLWRCEDTPYVPGIEIKFTQYFFLPPYLNLGSYLEDPTNVIPNYFLQPDRPLTELPPHAGISYPTAGSDNIFALNAGINPQDYSNSGGVAGSTQISWLRKADEIDYERTWFKLTSTWIGSVIGYFDAQLYGGLSRPQQPSDYVTFS